MVCLQIMTGLLDQYLVARNSQALKMVAWMADYFGKRVENAIRKYSMERHWKIINIEFGGMNDVLYRLHSVTVKLSISSFKWALLSVIENHFNMSILLSK